jgi:magnesium transporter
VSRRERRRSDRRYDEAIVGPPIEPPPLEPGLLECPQPSIRVIAYGPESAVEKDNVALGEIPELVKTHAVTWIDVAGLGDPDLVRRLAAMFNLHDLAVEDVLHASQRPKLEPYPDSLYLVLRMAEWVETLETEQLSLFLGKNWVLTFQEDRPGDCFDDLRARIRSGKGMLRRTGADHLVHALVDAVIDSNFPILEEIGERLEDLEGRILDQPSEQSAEEILRLKRELLLMRRIAWPTRDALGALHRDPSPLVGAEARILLRDCHDHAVQIMDLVETFREIASGLMELYLSSVSNRMNEIMKVLTIIATIFMPLSFIAGVYGMNFVYDPVRAPTNMPELHWPHGYVFSLGLMAMTAGGLLWYFKRRGWLGGRSVPRRQSARESAARP